MNTYPLNSKSASVLKQPEAPKAQSATGASLLRLSQAASNLREQVSELMLDLETVLPPRPESPVCTATLEQQYGLPGSIDSVTRELDQLIQRVEEARKELLV